MREGGLSARRPYVGCVLSRRHSVTKKSESCYLGTYTPITFLSLTSRGLPFIEVMAGLEYTVGERIVIPTVAYLNKIVFGVEVCLGLGGHRTWLSN